MLLSALIATTLQGQVIAYFSGGGSQANQVNNQVDAYRGAVGGGWTSRWTLRNDYGSGSMGDVAVNPAAGVWSDPHLKMTPSHNATGKGFGVWRTYGSHGELDIAAPVKITFSLSIDDLGDFLKTSTNQIFIGENGTESVNRTSVSSWLIQAFGGNDPNAYLTRPNYTTAKEGQWNLGDGSSFVPTGVLLKEDVLYGFEILINPQAYTYRVTISAEGENYQSGTLHFYTEQSLGRNLIFGQQYVETEGLAFSFGQLTIAPIPEPSLASLGLVGVLVLVLIRSRRNVCVK